jgi:hypothetical protein
MRDKAIATIVLAACSSAKTSEPDAPGAIEPPPAMVETGALVGGTGPWPGYIAGVGYHSGAQSGVTDAQGTFRYEAGQPVTFDFAGVTLRPTPGAAMVSPYQLAGGTCGDNADLDHLLVLLDSLDADGDATNGIAVVQAAGAPTTLDQLGDAGVQALVEQLEPGREPVDLAVAMDAFIRQIDGEVWQDLGKDTFTGTTAGVRSQGCATDGTAWYFSWRYGLERDDASFATQTSSLYAIPASIAATGSDHIGDIDVLGSTLYAPIEDSKQYAAPKIVAYDATTLAASTIYPLSNTLLTEGVPWVAVDGPRGQLYVAQWDPTPAILIHDLATVTFQRMLPLTPALGRIQGAKVFEGMLYASADDANKTIYKINLETGTAISLFGIAGSGIEEEGLCFAPRADGSTMHTMAAIASALSVELHHHARTRDPLRKMVCP